MSYQVRRYRIPNRSNYEEDREVDVKITKRTSDREQTYRDWEERDQPRRETRIVRERIVERSPSPEPYREVRVQREVIRERERERERPPPEYLERYIRETEYRKDDDRVQPIYITQTAPQPIIIREPAQQQIVLRERQRDEQDYQMERRDRQERNDDARSVALSHRSRRQSNQEDQEQDYVYKRRTRRAARSPTQDYEAQYRREVDPRDSVSNWGGAVAERNDNRRYEDNRRFDNEQDGYYRRTTEEYYSDDGGGGGGDRDHSPHHKRHVLEGAALGLGAAALLRNHNKKLGQEAGGAGRLAGGAALGAVGAEVLTRAHEHYTRSKSRNRGRSRSASPGPFSGNLTKLAGVAVLGALAGYAATRGKDGGAVGRLTNRGNSRTRGRSRSRSLGSESDDPDIAKDKQKATVVKAGLASAAVAGLVDRARSRSKGGRSRSRARALGPIVGAGLGGAALAGLYERQRGQKETARRASSRGQSPRRSRSRIRSSNPAGGGAAVLPADQALISYGADPISPSDRRTRARSGADNYYSDRDDRRRGHSRSPGSSASPRRNRNRSRDGRRRAETENRGPEPVAAYGPYAQEPPPPQAPSPNTGAPYHTSQQYSNNQYSPPNDNIHYPPQNTYQPPTNEAPYQSGYAPQGQGVTQATHSQWFPDGHNPPSSYPGYEPPRQDYNVSSSQGRDLGVTSSSIAAQRYTPQKRRSVSFATNPVVHTLPAQAQHETDSSHEEKSTDTSDDHSTRPVSSHETSNREGSPADTRSIKPHGQPARAQTPMPHQPRAARSRSIDSAVIPPPGVRHGQHHTTRSKPRPRASSLDDSVEEMPARFDRDGRRIVTRGEDPLADGLEDFMRGRGGEILTGWFEGFSGVGGGSGRGRKRDVGRR